MKNFRADQIFKKGLQQTITTMHFAIVVDFYLSASLLSIVDMTHSTKFETLSMITRESSRETDFQERQMPMDDEKPKTILDLLDEYKG